MLFFEQLYKLYFLLGKFDQLLMLKEARALEIK